MGARIKQTLPVKALFDYKSAESVICANDRLG